MEENLSRTMTTTLVRRHDGRSQIDVLPLDLAAGVRSRLVVLGSTRHAPSSYRSGDEICPGGAKNGYALPRSEERKMRADTVGGEEDARRHGRREGDARRHCGSKIWCCVEAPPHFESEAESER